MILGHFPQVRWYQVIDPQLVPRFIALFAAGWAIRTASRRSRSLFSAFFGTQKGLLQEWFFEGAMVVEHIHIIWSRIRSLLIDDCMALCYPRLGMITIPSHARDQSVGPLGLLANPLALAHRIWPRSLPDCCDTGPQTSVKCSTLRFGFEGDDRWPNPWKFKPGMRCLWIGVKIIDTISYLRMFLQSLYMPFPVALHCFLIMNGKWDKMGSFQF